MNRNYVHTLILTLGLLMAAPVLQSDDGMVVVTHPSNRAEIDSQYLYRLYFGKTSTFADGSSAVPLMYGSDNELLKRFANNALGRSARQLRSYWARQIFTGRGTPPREVSDLQEMKALISSNPDFIGYLPKSMLDDSVRAAFEVD